MLKIVLLGLEIENGNRGCEALGYSFIEILHKFAARQNVSMEIQLYAYTCTSRKMIEEQGFSLNTVQIHVKNIKAWKKFFDDCRNSDVIIDFSQGDSFSDIYGKKRFIIMTLYKQAALWSGKPLMLGPQTYGPYSNTFCRMWALHIIKKSRYVWARDQMSADYIKKIAKKEIKVTTDIAFELPYNKKVKVENSKILIGINPSGLLWEGGYKHNNQFMLSTDYQKYCYELIQTLLDSKRYEIHLISHVGTIQDDGSENDLTVCKLLHKKYTDTIVAPFFNTPMEAKTYISGMDIFIGARMHATIAAFSSGVVTIPFSYSRKFEGLYQSLKYPYVISGQKNTTRESIDKTISWINQYMILRKTAEESMVIVNQKQEELFNSLVQILK